MKNSFVMYTDYSTHIQLLSREQRGDLLTAVMAYASGEDVPDMDGMTLMAFSFIKVQMDRDNERYERTVEARREAGRQGGRPKASASDDKAKKANGFSKKQSEAKKPDNDNVTDNDTVNDTVKNNKYTCAFERLWSAYPRKKEKAKAYKCYKARLSDGFSEDELITAVKRYADECRKKRTEECYIKLAATFLGQNTPFIDYVERGMKDDTGKQTAGDADGIVEQAVRSGVQFDGF